MVFIHHHTTTSSLAHQHVAGTLAKSTSVYAHQHAAMAASKHATMIGHPGASHAGGIGHHGWPGSNGSGTGPTFPHPPLSHMVLGHHAPILPTHGTMGANASIDIMDMLLHRVHLVRMDMVFLPRIQFQHMLGRLLTPHKSILQNPPCWTSE